MGYSPATSVQCKFPAVSYKRKGAVCEKSFIPSNLQPLDKMEQAHFAPDGSQDLARIMQGRDTRWYRGHLGRLNGIIFLLLITSMTNGYDGSMMNGLQ